MFFVYIIYLLACIIYTVVNYSVLSAGEGWGVIAMLFLMGIGAVALLIDLGLIYLIRDRKLKRILRIILLTAFLIFLYSVRDEFY